MSSLDVFVERLKRYKLGIPIEDIKEVEIVKGSYLRLILYDNKTVVIRDESLLNLAKRAALEEQVGEDLYKEMTMRQIWGLKTMFGEKVPYEALKKELEDKSCKELTKMLADLEDKISWRDDFLRTFLITRLYKLFPDYPTDLIERETKGLTTEELVYLVSELSDEKKLKRLRDHFRWERYLFRLGVL